MSYTKLIVTCDPEFQDILIAEFGEAGFEMFLELENGFEAYCEEDKYDKELFTDITQRYSFVNPFDYKLDKVEKQNWNEEWEKNVEPIIVDDRCLVRAEFHKIDKQYPYEIIITPKMSFGTGHHQTTHLMLKAQLDIDHNGKRVMDAGCGTAILSIMASKRGAKSVEAFDIDDWSVINGKENIENNQCSNIEIQLGKISELNLQGDFDIILANINKNVLLAEMKTYSQYLKTGGLLLLSGFYTHDIDDLKQCASELSLNEIQRDERESWANLLLKKL